MASELEDLVERLSVALVVVGADGEVAFCTRAARQLLGETLASAPFDAWFGNDYRETARSFLASLAGRDADESVFFAAESAPPRRLWLEISAVNLTGVPGVGGFGLAIHDASEARRAAETARRDALTDALTGLPNRALLLERLTAARRSGQPGAAVYIDLDQFKAVNDTYGHTAGDTLLAVAAQRIAEVIPPSATVGRMGGDEFLLVLPDCDLAAAEAIAEAVVAAVRGPIDIGTAVVLTSASAGVASVAAPTPDTVLRNADVALYEAKAAGRAQVATYRPDSEAFARSRRELLHQVVTLRERNEELTAESRTDPLTGLPNRRLFDEALVALDAASRRGGRPYAVAYFDLDYFHDVNRAFDDATGDATLRAIATALSDACRAGDTIYRKGGEELVALLPDTDLAAALAVAERLRAHVRDLGLPTGRPDRNAVTVSGGVAALDPARHHTEDDVVAAANRAMLLAKRAGRDQIRTAEPPDANHQAG